MFNKKGGVTNKGVSYPPQGDTAAVAVSKDWEARDFTQTIQLGVSQLTLFLNQFGGLRLASITRFFSHAPHSAACTNYHVRAPRVIGIPTFTASTSHTTLVHLIQMRRRGEGYLSSTASLLNWRGDLS
jgi:hypothetical protein